MSDFNVTERSIIEALRQHGPMSGKKLAQYSGKSETQTKRYTDRLLRDGVVRRVGIGNGALSVLEIADPDRSYAEPSPPAEAGATPDRDPTPRVALAEELLEIERVIADADRRRAEILAELAGG